MDKKEFEMKTLIVLASLFLTLSAMAETNNLAESYVGIGAVIGYGEENDGFLRILRVAKDSSSDNAGLHSFDTIQNINGLRTDEMTLEEAVSMLRGPEGTIVTLIVKSITNASTCEVALVRQLFSDTSQIDWKNEILSTYQLPDSTNIIVTIKEI